MTRKVKGWRKDILTYFLFCNKNDKLFQVYKNLSSVFWSFISFMVTTNVGAKALSISYHHPSRLCKAFDPAVVRTTHRRSLPTGAIHQRYG